MVTFLAGGTGTPKLLAGADGVFDPAETTVVANTGDDVVLGGLLVCPDVDTVLFERAGILDRETWWGIATDSTTTHDHLADLAATHLPPDPQYLSEARQRAPPEWGEWRRFAPAPEFMTIGDRDRAIHQFRTGLLEAGHTLTDATRALADAHGLAIDLLPMSDDPVASLIHTPHGRMHFQEWWVHRGGEPPIEDVEFRGAGTARPTAAVQDALAEPVIIGPSNPVTSLGPMLAVPWIRETLAETTVVAVSPFVEDRVFSGPAGDLMAATGLDPSTAGVAEAYPFADAFVLDEADGTVLDRPTVRTDTKMDDDADATRVARAVESALEAVG